MGGSGGSYFRSKLQPEQLAERLREAENRTRDAAVEAEVSGIIGQLLADYNDRDTEALRKHLDEITSALGNEIDGTVELLFGGSVSKHTYVDGLSDVDCLVVLDSCELADQSPDQARAYFAERLRERFPRTHIREGNIAVTAEFQDMQIQLVPAVSCRNRLTISDESGTSWSGIAPKEFSEALTRANQQAGQKVVPVIKLAKGMIGRLPEKHRISGYHAEALAVDIFKDYDGPTQPKAMLQHFFEHARHGVLNPIRDRTGQSVHVDEYLGEPGSIQRRVISSAFNRISKRMRNADGAHSVEEWEDILSGP